MRSNDALKGEQGFTDNELVALAVGGDRSAFASIYGRYYARAYRLAYNMTGHRGGAEDLTQEIFMRVYQRLDSFNGQSGFATWFYRLAINHSLNYRRRADAQRDLKPPPGSKAPIAPIEEDTNWQNPELIPNDQSFGQNGEASVLQKQIQTEVHQALLELRAGMRMVIVLKDIEGLSYEEIAERLNCSPGTIASRLNRGRKQLAKKLRHLKGAI